LRLLTRLSRGDLLGPTSGATVVRGSLWEIVARSLPQLYVVVSSVFIARILGAASMGQITLIVTVQVLVMSLIVLGYPTALSRYVGELLGAGRIGEAHWLVNRVLLYAAPMTLAAFGIVAAGSLVGGGPDAAWIFAGIASAIGVLHTIPSTFLMGAQRWREARIVGISTGLLAMLAKVAVLLAGFGISALFFVDVWMAALNLVGTWMLAHPLLTTAPSVRLEPLMHKAFRRFANVAAVSVVLTLIINQRVEVFFLAHYRTEAEVAHYSVPFSLLVMMLWVPTAISYVFSPAVANLQGAGEIERIRSGFARVVRLSLLIGLFMTSFAVALGATLVRLVYGPQFAGLEAVVFALALAVPFVPIAMLSSSLLKGIGRIWGLAVMSAVAVVTDLGLAWLLVPAHGAAGAAIANTAGQVVWAIPMFWYARRLLGGVDVRLRLLLPAMIPTTAAAAVGLGLSLGIPGAAGDIAGAVAFAVTLVGGVAWLRPLPVEDGLWIEALAGDRFGGFPRRASSYARGALDSPA
jgi:O-antigen/teichoic acid export membrane protein